jgi:hypothetical protein
LLDAADGVGERGHFYKEKGIWIMDKSKRKELVEEYLQIKIFMGVVKITNRRNGKIFLASYPNLKNKWSTIQAQLEMGRFTSLQLQKDWNEQGAADFEYEVIEQKDAGEIKDIRWEQKQLLKKWLERLQPFGERGYNKPLER